MGGGLPGGGGNKNEEGWESGKERAGWGGTVPSGQPGPFRGGWGPGRGRGSPHQGGAETLPGGWGVDPARDPLPSPAHPQTRLESVSCQPHVGPSPEKSTAALPRAPPGTLGMLGQGLPSPISGQPLPFPAAPSPRLLTLTAAHSPVPLPPPCFPQDRHEQGTASPPAALLS